MDSNRGQVTLFVILGIIILTGVIFALIFLNKANPPEEPPKTTIGIETFEVYVKNCLEASAKKSALQIALNSYYEEPVDMATEYAQLSPQQEVSSAIGRNMARYYVDKGTPAFPTKDEVETAFSKLLMAEIDNCLLGLKEFEDQGYIYTMQPKRIDVEEGTGKIVLKMELPIQVTYKGKDYSLSSFTTEVRYPFYGKYTLVSNFVNTQRNSTEYLELGYLANLAYSNGFKWEAYYLGDKVTLIKIIFTDAKETLGKDMVVPFAVRTS